MGGGMKLILIFLMIFSFLTVRANETIVKLENNQIKLWIEPEQMPNFKDGNFFMFDNGGMNEILAYKKTAELYKNFECPKCEQKNNTIWYLVSFGAGVVLGGLIVKVMK